MSTLYVRSGVGYREATIEEISSHPAVTDRLVSLDTAATPATFQTRRLLVSTYGDLRIGGRWFDRAGFSPSARVSILVFQNRLIIDVVQEPTQITPRHHRKTAASLSRE